MSLFTFNCFNSHRHSKTMQHKLFTADSSVQINYYLLGLMTTRVLVNHIRNLCLRNRCLAFCGEMSSQFNILRSEPFYYQPHPLSYFSVVVCLRCLLHHILSLIAYTFVFIIMMSANIRIRFGLQIVFVCLYITPSHHHHCANLSEDIELLKCLSDIFCRVCE